MKKIYMRAGMSPTEILEPGHMLLNNSIGYNVGNLLYAFGVNRALTVEDTEVVPNYYKVEPSKADKINETYDAFIIPLADAFRNDAGMRAELRNMTALIKKLTIPCIVIGAGLSAPFEPNLQKKFAFDDDVKAFLSAVLDKSSIVGVRGEITSQYLSNLGFIEGKHHMVIGCPSMYTYGKHLKIRDTSITKDSRISVNSSILSPVNVLNFLNHTMEEIKDHYFLPQRLQEMKLVYTGAPYVHEQKGKEMYPTQMTDRLYRENRVRFMLNVPTWLDFLRQADLSIGGRLHGNIAATVAGTPSILIPHDARMRELTEYHNLTHVWAKDIKEDTDVFELASKLNFHGVENVHEKNFERYVDFLDKNNLNHIFKNGEDPEESPLDRRVKEVGALPPLETIQSCSFEELVERWQSFYPADERKTEKLKKEVRELRAKTKTLETKVKKLEKEVKASNENKEDKKASAKENSDTNNSKAKEDTKGLFSNIKKMLPF